VITGAPRPMKMGTIASPWHYDAGACGALQPLKLRRPWIACYTKSARTKLTAGLALLVPFPMLDAGEAMS
jgi:hypothetical protein